MQIKEIKAYKLISNIPKEKRRELRLYILGVKNNAHRKVAKIVTLKNLVVH